MMDIPETSVAYVMHPGERSLQRVERPVQRPGPGEALVRIEACGVCGSDVFLQEGGFGDKLPVVPGHEAAGRVVAIGDGADANWLGAQVALYYIDAPASQWSERGRGNLGDHVTRMGVDTDGAFAEYIIRPIRTLVRVAPELPPEAVAVATDALATPWHALSEIARLRAGETLAVIGPGGIGSNAVQIGRHLGARVIAVGRSAAKLEQARLLGAEVTVDSSAGATAIVEAAGGRIDVVLQAVGENSAMDRLAVDIAGIAARIVYVGVSHDPFTVAATELIWKELSLLGSRGFTTRDIEVVLDLVRNGELDTEHLTQSIRPLHEVDAALDDLRSGRVLRTVLVP